MGRNDSDSTDWALFLLPCFSAPLSLMSSAYVVHLIIKRRKKTLCRPREQILLGLSLLDMSFSFALSFSTLPVPAVQRRKLPTVGTVATCSAQGFLVQLGLGAPIYNACLCMYYFLSIRYKVSDEALMQWAIPSMHAFILTFSFGTAIAGLLMEIFNSAGVMGCWIHNSNSLCHSDPQYCGRGAIADDFALYFGLIHIGICFVLVVISMIGLFFTVRAIELRSRRWEFQDGRDNKNMPLTRRTIETGVFYSASFLAIWLPTILLGFAFEGGNDKKLNSGYKCVQVLSVILQPLQGFFNLIIYTSPEWLPWFKKSKCCTSCCRALQKGNIFRKKNDTIDENDDDEDKEIEAELSMDLFSVKDAIDDHLSREFVPMAQRRSARRARGRPHPPCSRENSLAFSLPFSEGESQLQLSSTFHRAELHTLQENSREGRGSSTSDLRRSSIEEISDSLRRSSFEEVRFEIEASSLSFHAGNTPSSIVEVSDDEGSVEDDRPKEKKPKSEAINERDDPTSIDEMKVELGAYELHQNNLEEEKHVEIADDNKNGVRELHMQDRVDSMADSVLDSSDGTTLEFVSSSDCSTVHA
jgi:hypothetical protein